MSDLHITAQLLTAPTAGAPVLAAATPAAGTPPGPASGALQGADVFSAVLAGKLALTLPATAATDSTETALPETAGAGAAGKDAKNRPQDKYVGEPLPPEATIQLLVEMGVLAPQPAQGTVPATLAPAAGSAPAQPPHSPISTTNIKAAPLGAVGEIAATPAADKAAAEDPVPNSTPPAQAADASAPPTGPHLPATGHDPFAATPPAAVQATPDAAAVQAATTLPGATGAPAPAIQMAVPSLVGTPLWREEFAASVNLLATQRVSSAELRVQPAELGPVHVSIRIEAGEANITCAAQHADTRHALEAALPRLRELLEANGIAVGNASVGPQSSGQGSAGAAPQGRQHGGSDPSAAAADSVVVPAARAPVRSDQLVDVFA